MHFFLLEMDILEALEYSNFVIVGDTLNKDKYAYLIKEELLNHGYQVEGVYKELASIDEISFTSFVLDMVINPVKGYELLKNMTKTPLLVIFQPNTISEEIIELLVERKIDYIEDCVLVGLRRKYAYNRG